MDKFLVIEKKPTLYKKLQLSLGIAGLAGILSAVFAICTHNTLQTIFGKITLFFFICLLISCLVEGFKYGILVGRGGTVYYEDTPGSFVCILLLYVGLICILCFTLFSLK